MSEGSSSEASQKWLSHIVCGYATPLFCEKRLQTIENKASAHEKEYEERKRGGKLMKREDLRPTGCNFGPTGHKTPRVLYRCENTRLARKGIRKIMKTGEKEIDGM